MKAVLDGDGYPTYETLETISKFKIENEQSIAEFFNYCESAYNKHYGVWEIVEEYDEYVFDRDRLTVLLIVQVDTIRLHHDLQAYSIDLHDE